MYNENETECVYLKRNFKFYCMCDILACIGFSATPIPSPPYPLLLSPTLSPLRSPPPPSPSAHPIQASFWDNTAHTGLLGLSVLGLPSSCTAIGGFSAMFQWNYGVFSSTASSLVATHLKIAAGKVGLNLNVFGPNPVEHFLGRKSITIAGG